MKSLKCSDVTGLQCTFTVTVGKESKLKDSYVDHFKQSHIQQKDTLQDKNRKLREVRSKVDTLINKDQALKTNTYM